VDQIGQQDDVRFDFQSRLFKLMMQDDTEKVEGWRTFTCNCQKDNAALPANVFFREFLN
jgi:hypothetical protein